MELRRKLKEWIRWIVLLVLLVPFMQTLPVEAATTVNLTVVARGWIVGAPSGFIVYYITDNSVGINWTIPSGAVNIMIRAAYGRVPVDVNDGYQVYYGSGNHTVDNGATINAPEILYYNAWAQTAAGLYGDPMGGDTSSFMSISFLFIGLLALATALTIACFKWKDVLLSYAAALVWLAQGFWWLLGNITNFGMGTTWFNILIWVPFVMFFVVLLRLMNTEIQMEQNGVRWTEMGGRPKRNRGPSSYESYAKELRRRTRGG